MCQYKTTKIGLSAIIHSKHLQWTQLNEVKMVKTQVATKALKKKSSFMIEDLLHTAHDEMPRTTDRSSREPVAKFYISTAGLYSAKDNPTQIIRHDVDTKSRGKCMIVKAIITKMYLSKIESIFIALD